MGLEGVHSESGVGREKSAGLFPAKLVHWQEK